jgi:riboflavin kinase/FMN adenylyltransferase
MKILSDISITEPAVITFGNFDGVHKGHTALIRAAKASAAEIGAVCVVFTFDPHPAKMLKNPAFRLIYTRDEKRGIIEKRGVDILVEYPFTREVANMPPADFCREVFGGINIKAVFVGEKFKFGANGGGDVDLLKKFCAENGASFTALERVTDETGVICSTRIRSFLEAGEIDKANNLLVESYFMTGVVARGRGLGYTIGFRTANLTPPEGKLLPPDGVYATTTTLRGQKFKSITNIGLNPTVDGTERTVETHLFGVGHMFYHETITVEFLGFMRGVVKFGSIEELRKQLVIDSAKRERF